MGMPRDPVRGRESEERIEDLSSVVITVSLIVLLRTVSEQCLVGNAAPS